MSAQAQDARLFPQTGYRVGDDAFWTYFRRRGGVRTFGYPVSNPFTLQGFRVQIFQRAILQLQPNGSVAIANVLDEGLLPYTTINGSAFPAADPEVIRRQPQVGEPNYHAQGAPVRQGERAGHLAGPEGQLLPDVRRGRARR